MQHRYLRDQMTALGLAASVQDFILDEMTAPSRHYHSVAHLAMMLQVLERAYLHSLWKFGVTYAQGVNIAQAAGELNYRQGGQQWALTGEGYKLVRIATLFHDVIYDPTAPDNEERSAIEARLRLSNDVDHSRIAKMIVATKDHDLDAAPDAETYWLLFADLAILWTKQLPRYAWYAHGVRKEYAHVPANLYQDGRMRVLEKLHEMVVNHFGEHNPEIVKHAKVNLRWELDGLMKGEFD